MNRFCSILKFLLIAILLLGFSCSLKDPFGDQREDLLKDNQPPETHLFLIVDQEVVTVQDTLADGTIVVNTHTTGLDTTASRQIIHWWGDDPDGEVTGYYYLWNYQTAETFTTEEYDTFFVPIRSAYDEFTIQVWAVDDQDLRDPSPAQLTFPVYNSPPEIYFRLGSNPSVTGSDNVVAYTFPTRTFIWDAQDPDGRETITAIWYALDDTTQWTQLPGDADQITLRDLEPGLHRFYVRAMDISGALSNTIVFPDTGDPAVPNFWEVKEPKGDILLVNDFAQDQNTHTVQSFYTDILNDLVGVDGYSVWEIGSDRIPAINSQNAFPYSSFDVEANFSYFSKVIWFSHLGRPNITSAGLSITRFMKNGGKIFITNGNEEAPDTTWFFTRIDSVFRLNPGGRLMSGVRILSEFEEDGLDLSLGQLVGNRVSALLPGTGSDVVYRMEADSTATVAVPYKGSPPVGIRYRIGNGESIYFSLPLHYCNGENNMADVLEYILFEEFGP